MSPAAAAAGFAALVVFLLWAPSAGPARASPARWRRVLPLVGLAGFAIRPGHWTVLALIMAGTGLAARALWSQRAEARRTGQSAARVVEVCDLIAAELSSGRPAELALEEAAAAWPLLRPVAEAGRLGSDVPAAVRAVAETPGADGLRLLAGAWAVSHRTGAGLAESARRVADATRRDLATRRVVAGELSSARSTARLVALLPALALLMGSGAGADPWTFLLATPFGLACLASGLAVGFAGLWWIELIALDVGG